MPYADNNLHISNEGDFKIDDPISYHFRINQSKQT